MKLLDRKGLKTLSLLLGVFLIKCNAKKNLKEEIILLNPDYALEN